MIISLKRKSKKETKLEKALASLPALLNDSDST